MGERFVAPFAGLSVRILGVTAVGASTVNFSAGHDVVGIVDEEMSDPLSRRGETGGEGDRSVGAAGVAGLGAVDVGPEC